MRVVLRCAGLLLVAVMAVGQTHTSSKHFYWSLSKAHELDYDKTLANTTALSPLERTALIQAIQNVLAPAMRTEFSDEGEKLIQKEQQRRIDAQVMKTRIYLVDLNHDGVPEVIAQPSDYTTGLCGATGNCSFWIFSKSGDHYVLLFDSGEGNGFEMFTIESTSTNGYLDLVLAAHDSAAEKFLARYRYSHGTYQLAGCYDANWMNYHDFSGLKNPVISQISCGK
jgi:hypothetical protein